MALTLETENTRFSSTHPRRNGLGRVWRRDEFEKGAQETNIRDSATVYLEKKPLTPDFKAQTAPSETDSQRQIRAFFVLAARTHTSEYDVWGKNCVYSLTD